MANPRQPAGTADRAAGAAATAVRLSMLMPAGAGERGRILRPAAAVASDRRIRRAAFTVCSSASDQDGAPPGDLPGPRGLPWTI